jgi:hypothetical protein
VERNQHGPSVCPPPPSLNPQLPRPFRRYPVLLSRLNSRLG